MNTSDSILATIDSLNDINESIYGSYNLEHAFQMILEKVGKHFSFSFFINNSNNGEAQ